MAKVDVNAEDGVRMREQIAANIERARSLAEAENGEGLEELGKETENLISSLAGKGSLKVKQELRAQLAEASAGAPKAATGADVVTFETPDYAAVEGVPELVDMGAGKLTEGVRLHMKASDVAREVAQVVIDLRRRLRDKHGLPDLRNSGAETRRATNDMYDKVRAAMAANPDMDEFEAREAAEKFIKSVQNWYSDTLAEYARGLDGNPEEAALYAEITKGRTDKPVSELVSAHYGFNLKGQREIMREKQRERAAILAKREAGEELSDAELDTIGEHPADPAEQVSELFERVTKGVERVVKGVDDSEREEIGSKIDAAILRLTKLRAQL